DGDVALGELQGFGDLIQREGMVLEEQDAEDASLQLREDAGGRRRGAHPLDEERPSLVDRSLFHRTVCLEYFERSRQPQYKRAIASSRPCTNVNPLSVGASSGRCVRMKNGTPNGLWPPQASAARRCS